MSNKNRDTKPLDAFENILSNMVDVAPYKIHEHLKPYILEAMQEAANWQKEQYTERVEGETLYPFTEAKLMATRFAKYSRDAGDVTSNDTITSFDNWFKPEYFKPVVTTPSTSTTIEALAEKWCKENDFGHITKIDAFKFAYSLRDKEHVSAVALIEAVNELLKCFEINPDKPGKYWNKSMPSDGVINKIKDMITSIRDV